MRSAMTPPAIAPALTAEPGWPERPLTVIAAARVRDLPVLDIVSRKLPLMVPFKQFVVVSPDKERAVIQTRLGVRARVISENNFVPGITLDSLRGLPVEGFPRAAGWYFQQLLKLQFAFIEPEDDYYLIWDADTVPLRPMRFFDDAGCMLLTKATEHHTPYFETYRRLLGEEPNREFSFIAQHILVQKSVAREMLGNIERHIPGEGNWAWKIMRTLPEHGVNLFSEYETYGHFVKQHYPDRVRFIERLWRRDPSHKGGCAVPIERELRTASEKYEFAAYERAEKGWRRLARRFLSWCR
jgi:hypothetical protein